MSEFMIPLYTEYYKQLKYNEIRQLRCDLIDKKQLLKYFEQSGYDLQHLQNMPGYMRKKGISHCDAWHNHQKLNDFFFYGSLHNLEEQPYNVIVNQSVLDKIALQVFTVNKDKIEYLKR